jgi:hypothetical protein
MTTIYMPFIESTMWFGSIHYLLEDALFELIQRAIDENIISLNDSIEKIKEKIYLKKEFQIIVKTLPTFLY